MRGTGGKRIVKKNGGNRFPKGLFFLIVTAALTSAFLHAGGRPERTASNPEMEKVRVFVSILPQRFFVERIAGGRAVVSVMVPPGQSPHSYEPSPKQIQDLGLASVYFSAGVEFEKAFLPVIASNLPDLPILDSTAGITRRMLEAYGSEEKGPDPHVWLGLDEGRIIADNVLKGLAEAAPRYAAEFESNYRDLLKDIDRIKGELAAVLAPLKGKTLLVYHPAFGYFADNFGLRQEAVETGGTEPTARQLEAIIRKARQEGVHVIFVQPQFAKKSAETVAKAINGSVVPIDPLSADWLKNLENIAAIVRNGLGGK